VKSPEEVARDYFTDLPLLTHTGEEVHFFTDVLRDRIVLINSFYTHCHGISPRQGQVLARLQEQLGESLGREVFIVSITVDPEHDTVPVIRDFAAELGAGPGWIFLTGKPENVNWVNHRLGQYVEDLEEHEGVYMLGNVRTTLWMKLPPHAQPFDLHRQIRLLLGDEAEAGGGESG